MKNELGKALFPPDGIDRQQDGFVEKKETRNILAVVTRPKHNGGPTCAVINATVPADWCNDWDTQYIDSELVFHNLCHAVENWVNASPHGRRAIRSTECNFNIGDLALEIANMGDLKGNPDELAFHLAKQGFVELTIECADDGSEHTWDYDDLLFREDEVDMDAIKNEGD